MRIQIRIAAVLTTLALVSQPCQAQTTSNTATTSVGVQQTGQDLPTLPVPGSSATAGTNVTPVMTRPKKSMSRLKVTDYKKDWRQAGDGQDGLDNRLRSHVVRIDEDGVVKGRIGTIESATGDLEPVRDIRIRFVRKGEEIAQTAPNPDGSFSVRNLEPGVYSMIAVGEGGFIACSVNIQPKLSDVAKMPMYKQARFLKQEVKRLIDIESAAVSPDNFIPLKSLLRSYLPSEESSLVLDGPEIPGGMLDVSPENARLGTPLRHHQIRLSKDGKLRGRVRRLQPESGRDLKIRDLNVFLLRNNINVAQEEVTPDGTFAFGNVRPGVYSMVAAGKDGFVAFSIDVLKPRATEDAVSNESKLQTTSMRIDDGWQAELAIDVALVSPADLNAANVDQMTDNFLRNDNGAPVADAGAAPPAAGGAMPGVSGGGFGPVGGSGGIPPSSPGLGSILTSTAIGVGVSTLADDDDDRQQSSPASPGNGSTSGQ